MNKYLNLQNNNQVLSKADKDKLNFALAELFFGLSRANLTRVANLGMARQKALEQIGSYLKSKDTNNPVVQHMYKTYMENKAKWAKAIMTSKKSENAVKLPKENMQKNEAWGAKWVNEALGKLNTKIKEFEPRTNTYAKAAQAVKGKSEEQPKAVIIELQNAELSHEKTKKLIQMAIEKAREYSMAG